MKAVAVFPEKREVTLIETEEPQLTGPRSVKLRMLEVGICGTDREITAFQYGTPPDGSPYLILGHESLGEVVEVGPEVETLRPGDLAVPMVRRPCPHARCFPCRQGRADFCTTGDFTERGIKQAHGFLAEWVVEEERFLIPVPHALREVAVLAEPLTIAEKAVQQVETIQRRLPWGGAGGAQGSHRALVLGAGPVGLLGAMTLVRRGFETHVYSREPVGGPKSAAAARLGAGYLSAGDLAPSDVPKRIGPIDLVFEAVGASRVAFEFIPVLAPNAVFVFTGVPGRKGPIEVDTDRLMRDLVLRNQLILGTVNAGRSAYEAAVRELQDAMEEREEGVRALLTGRFSLGDAPQRLCGPASGIKNVVAVGQS